MTPQARPHQLTPGMPFVVLAPITERFTADDDLPFDVELMIDFDEEAGRLVCTDFRQTRVPGGPSIGTEASRRVNVSGLTRAAIHAAAAGLFFTLPNPQRHPEWNEAWTALQSDAHAVAKLGPTELAIRSVAILYAQSFAAGEPPVETVARELGITRATAARWVATARNDRGYLRETEPRRAGN
jgi:hypothetical protein